MICYVCETEVDACCNVCVPCYDKLQAELDKAIGKLTREMLDHTGTKLALAKLKERIEFAIDYLPECPDKAKSFLESVKPESEGSE